MMGEAALVGVPTTAIVTKMATETGKVINRTGTYRNGLTAPAADNRLKLKTGVILCHNTDYKHNVK